MRNLLIATIAVTALAAAPSAASANPILEASCKLQEKLGVENVQGCNLS